MLFPSRRRVHLPVTDKHSRTLDVSARHTPARPLSGRLLFFVVYLGNVARRREREGRCTKAATDAELLQVPPPLRDYSCDGYSASCSLGCATRVPDPQPLGEILSHSHARARATRAPCQPLAEGGKKRLSAFAGIIALTNHRRARCGAHQPLSSLGPIHSSSHFFPFRQSSRIRPPGVVGSWPGLRSLYRLTHSLTLSLSLSLSLSASFWLLHLLASTHSTFHFHSVAAALRSKESES